MNKKVTIMQPYFFPYIGYFQLINSVDEFVIYDNIQYTKKGWINRNQILVNGTSKKITVPLKKGSDYLNIVDRKLPDSWSKDRKKLLNLIHSSYEKAPFFKEAHEVVERSLMSDEVNLFKFLFNNIKNINEYLGIKTAMTISSDIDIDHTLKSTDKVLAICENRGADTYINAAGGVDLYDKNDFKKHGINLTFINSEPIVYYQFSKALREFVPWLSIIDVIMFNSKETVREYLDLYSLK